MCNSRGLFADKLRTLDRDLRDSNKELVYNRDNADKVAQMCIQFNTNVTGLQSRIVARGEQYAGLAEFLGQQFTRLHTVYLQHWMGTHSGADLGKLLTQL